MGYFKVRNKRQIITVIRKEMRKVLRSQKMRDDVGRITVGGMRNNYMRGASELTQEIRKELEPYNKTSGSYKRRKLNATFTGELLSDLIGNVKAKFNNKDNYFIVGHTKKLHKKYKTKTVKGKKKRSSKRVSYRDIAKKMVAMDLNYFKLKAKDAKRVTRIIKRNLFRGMNKL